MKLRALPVGDLVARIERLQKQQRKYAENSVAWSAAHITLGPLLAEMKRREKANGGEPNWRKWKADANADGSREISYEDLWKK